MPHSARLHRFRTTVVTAILATVVTTGLIAAPAQAGPPGAVPTIWPQPQSLTSPGTVLQLPASATVVTGTNGDPSTVALVRSLLQTNGTATTTSPTDPGTGAAVFVGGPSENAGSASALTALGVTATNSSTAASYILASGTSASGRQLIVLSGADTRGTYYAGQSLRQLTGPGTPGASVWRVTVKDAPAFGFRGGMQSFYGPLWSSAQETSFLDFLAATKMDTYFYGPSEDPQTGGFVDAGTVKNWRTSYDQAHIDAIAATVAAASARHIDYIYRISPSVPRDTKHGFCFTDPTGEDHAALSTRLTQLYTAGVRRFVVAWDDLDLANMYACDSDKAQLAATTTALATAQADVTNFVQNSFIASHQGASLQVVPTYYAGTHIDPAVDPDGAAYRSAFQSRVLPSVDFWWTGPQVISRTISANDLTGATTGVKRDYPAHKIAIWDNYPVNDYSSAAPSRIILGPVTGRDGALAAGSTGIMFNGMPQEELSQLAIFTGAAFSWNPTGYSPSAAWDAAIAYVGGSRAAALKAFAQNNYASTIDSNESLALGPLINAFRQAWQSNQGLTSAASNLTAGFTALRSSVSTLRQPAGNTLLAGEAGPWLDKADRYGQAGQAAVTALVAERNGDTATMTQNRQTLASLVTQLNGAVLPGSSVRVREGVGVLDPFLQFALGRGTGLGDLSGTGRSDLLGVMADGTLNAYANVTTSSGQAIGDGATSFGLTTTVGGGWSQSMKPITGDLCGDRRLDLLSIDSAGIMRAFPNKGNFTVNMFDQAVQVGQGWSGALSVSAVDLDADGRADLLGVLPNGTLIAVHNNGCTNGVPSFGTSITVGSGWSSSMLPIVGDFSGDGRADLLSVSGGFLRSYVNTGSFSSGMFGPPTQAGPGWGGALMVRSVDLDGDGRTDIAAVLSDGTLVVIPTTGVTNGVPSYGATVTIGSGWSTSRLPVFTDLNGDGRADVLSVDPGGNLIESVNLGGFDASMFGPGTEVGAQWQGALFIL